MVAWTPAGRTMRVMTVAPRSEPLRFRDIADVAAAVRRDGGRLTMPRRLVLEALFAADTLVSAEHIALGTDTGVEIELTSVYRNLERLEELGVIRHLHVGHGPGLYGLVGEGEREYLVCEACGKVTAARGEQLDRARAVIRQDLGYEARFTHFPIHGLCTDCVRVEPG
jgi:Fur family ferric uptake transcriptional regulator